MYTSVFGILYNINHVIKFRAGMWMIKVQGLVSGALLFLNININQTYKRLDEQTTQFPWLLLQAFDVEQFGT